jgi:hypothetical protein
MKVSLLEDRGNGGIQIMMDGNDQWDTSQFQYILNIILRVDQCHPATVPDNCLG